MRLHVMKYEIDGRDRSWMKTRQQNIHYNANGVSICLSSNKVTIRLPFHSRKSNFCKYFPFTHTHSRKHREHRANQNRASTIPNNCIETAMIRINQRASNRRPNQGTTINIHSNKQFQSKRIHTQWSNKHYSFPL